MYPPALPLSDFFSNDVKERREGATQAQGKAKASGDGKRKGADAPAGSGKVHPPTEKGKKQPVGGSSEDTRKPDASPAIPEEVLREVREPPVNSSLYTLSRLLGFASPAGGGHPHHREDKRGAKKKGKKNAHANAGGGADEFQSALAPVTALNTASLLGQLHDRIKDLTESLQKTQETDLRVGAAGAGNVAGKRRDKTCVTVTLDSESVEAADADAGASKEGKQHASFVDSKDATLPRGAGGDADGADATPSKQGTPAVGAAAAATRVGGGWAPSIATPFGFALDWKPKTTASDAAEDDEAGDAPPSSKSRASTATQQQGRRSGLASLSKSANDAGNDANALHVSMLHGSCAALSLI